MLQLRLPEEWAGRGDAADGGGRLLQRLRQSHRLRGHLRGRVRLLRLVQGGHREVSISKHFNFFSLEYNNLIKESTSNLV